MSLPSVSFSRGVALALVIPWLLALAAVVFGVFAWSRSPNGSANGRPLPVAGSEELKSLRLALTTSSAENQALRKELDRLQESLRASGGGAQQLLGTSGGGLQAPDDLKRELADRLQELLAKAASGDERSQAEAARAIFDLLRGGSAAFSALRDVYLKTADAKGRNLLLASMVFSGAPQARDFVFDQVQTEKDPEIRRALTTQAA